MLFESLSRSAEQGELILVEGGYCRYHLRQDGQVTIYEILVLPVCRRQGIGQAMLQRLTALPGATSVFARCPADLAANGWYAAMGFELEGTEHTRSGRLLNRWHLAI